MNITQVTDLTKGKVIKMESRKLTVTVSYEDGNTQCVYIGNSRFMAIAYYLLEVVRPAKESVEVTLGEYLK